MNEEQLAEAPEEEGFVDAPEESTETDAPEEKEAPMVPIHALHEARQELREAREKWDAEREQLTNSWQQQFHQFAEEMKKPASQPEPEVTDDPDDPVGTIMNRLDRLDRGMKKFEDMSVEEQKQAQRAAQQNQLMSFVNQDYQQTKSEIPDLDDAVNHMRDARAKQLRSLGMGPQAASQQVAQEVNGAIAMALQNNQSPARALYQYAQGFGYQKAGETPGEASVSSEQIEAVAKGQKAAQNLNGGGDAAPNKITQNSLEKIKDPEEFRKAFYKVYRGS